MDIRGTIAMSLVYGPPQERSTKKMLTGPHIFKALLPLKFILSSVLDYKSALFELFKAKKQTYGAMSLTYRTTEASLP